MSSTNRGYSRHASDYYITPQEPIREFLAAWVIDAKLKHPELLNWFDPCAGGDERNPMSYPTAIQAAFDPEDIWSMRITTMDIREDSRALYKKDYLKTPMTPSSIIITNPPFYLAQEIIEKALTEIKPDGFVIMLLRLNFFGSQARFPLFQRHMPKWAYVHHKRISFTAEGATDSIEYMHAVWTTEQTKSTILRVI